MRHAAICTLFFAPLALAGPVATPDQADGIYRIGETVGWHVALPPGSASGSMHRYTVRKNNQSVIGGGTLDLERPGRIEVKVDEPAMLYVSVTDDDPATEDLVLGAAIAPELLQPSAPAPADFDAFWATKIELLQSIPPNPVLTSKPTDKAGVEHALVRMNHIEGRSIHGQLAKPSRPGKFPALVLFQWAGGPYPLQPQWVIDRAAEGWLVINIEPHDVLPDQPESYYDALPKELKEYSNIGRDDRERNYFLQMYLADYRAVDYLASRADWDGRTMVVMGTSMGGQQALCTAALHPKVSALIAHVPSGADSNGPLHGRASGYPFWNAQSPQQYATALYFDTVNCAARIRVPALVSMGFLDTISPPVGIYIAFNQIRGYKEVIPLVDSPHNHQATPEQQAPYTNRANQWLEILRNGGDIAASLKPE